MAEVDLRIRTPLEGLVQPGRFGAASSNPGLLIEEITDLALATMTARRGVEQDLKHAVAEAYGLELPHGPRISTRNGVSFAGTGIGQWLAAAEGLAAAGFVPRLREHLKDLASIADQSDGRVVLRLSGERVREVLSKGIPVDLHPRSFRTGHVASTTVAQIGVQIQQLGDQPVFRLIAFRSFAGSLLSWLTKSAAEFGYEIAHQEH